MQTQAWKCHWTHVTGRTGQGQPSRLLMWICEYPYRTMRATGPCAADCEGCPLFEARKAIPVLRPDAPTALITTH